MRKFEDIIPTFQKDETILKPNLHVGYFIELRDNFKCWIDFEAIFRSKVELYHHVSDAAANMCALYKIKMTIILVMLTQDTILQLKYGPLI